MVGIGYFPFFFGADLLRRRLLGRGFRAAFLAAGASSPARLLGGGLLRRRLLRRPAFFASAAFVGPSPSSAVGRLPDLHLRRAPSRPSAPCACPSAPDSISTTSDQSRWYVETSLYGITCASGRLRAAQEHVRLHAVREDQHLPVGDVEARQQLQQQRRLRRVVGERVDDEHRVLAGARVERALAGERAHLLRHRLACSCGRRAGRTPCRRPATAGRGSSPDGRGRCPSASTASGCRRPRGRASWWTRCPGAGWRGTPSPPGASPAR